MKIAIIGYGKMGQMIERAALSRGHTIVARISSSEWELQDLSKADLCIEFTRPDSVLENIQKIAKLKKSIVIGTTGWYDQIEQVRSIVNEKQIGALYSPNFSIGIHLFLHMIEQTSKLMNSFIEYDVAGIEYHHKGKKDSPSGTALEISKKIEVNMNRIEKVPFSSVRCGSIPGTHTVIFDSPCDTISISHEARNREGFATGAVQAAEWLKGKQGLFTFSDYIMSIMQRRT